MIDQVFPILSTTDVSRSLGFWRDLLGGTVAFEWPGPDCEPVYVGVDVGPSHIGIGLAADGRAATPGAIALWVYVSDCDGVVRRLRDAGVTVTAEP
jgi:lactoylglutathione lyase